jgi:hypothetical protein
MANPCARFAAVVTDQAILWLCVIRHRR